MLIYDNEYEKKENKNWTKDKMELQHIYITVATDPLICLVTQTKQCLVDFFCLKAKNQAHYIAQLLKL